MGQAVRRADVLDRNASDPDVAAMATMIGEVYDALLEAGASPAKARSAAEAVATYDNRLNALSTETKGEFAEVKRDITALRGEVNLLKWMVGFNLAGTVAILLKMLHG